MKNKLRNTIIWLILIVLFSAIAYASVIIAKDRKSTKLPWQWTTSWFYDTAHNVWDSNVAQDRFTAWTDIVTDSVTWLMWQKDWSTNNKNWDNAKVYCADLNLWWYDNWRLPNIKELQSIADYTRYNPAIDTSKFTNTAYNYYWSSTTRSNNTSSAWVVYFYNANSFNSNKTNTNYVRCIR